MEGADYAQQVLASGYERQWLNWNLDVRRDVRAGRPFIYGSPYRPTVHLPDANVAAVAGGTKAMVFTTRPLTLVELERHELIPISNEAIGETILATAKALGQPVELAQADGVRVALLFRNPRRIWQMSYFEDGVGPTGHIEGHDPAALAATAWRLGYRRFAQGMVDAISSNLSGLTATRGQMERLFFIYMPGCPTCAAVKPIVRAFRDANYGHVNVIPVDITAVEWNAKKWIPQVTPTLIRLDSANRYHVFDGRPVEDGQGRIVAPEEVRSWLLRHYPSRPF